MAEKNFYGSDGQFKGSMDDNGRIYDANHGFIGYVKDGRIYDNCNLPHGHITDSGMVVDNYMQEVGQEYGTGFSSRGTRQELGLVRAEILSEGRGRDYGAFQLLDRDQRHKYDSYPYGGDTSDTDNYSDDTDNYSDDTDNYSDDTDNYSDEVDDYENDDPFDDGYDDSFDARPSRRHSDDGDNGGIPPDEHTAVGCGCTILIFIGLYIIFRMLL